MMSTISKTHPAAARFDKVEQSMGISTYLSPSVMGFAGVSKARYSDFLVREVGLDGSVAALTPTTTATTATREAMETTQQAGQKRKRQDEDNSTTTDKPASLGDWKQELTRQLTPLLPSHATAAGSSTDEKTTTTLLSPEQVVQKVVDMLSYWEDKKKKGDDNSSSSRRSNQQEEEKNSQFVTLPAMSDKRARRAVHQLLKQEPFSNVCCADTKEGGVLRIWHISFASQVLQYGQQKQGNNNRQKQQQQRRRPPWPSNQPPFLKFVLYKENIDTGVAVKDISKRLGGGGGGGRGRGGCRLGFAGMKDKRGVTAQFCTLKHTWPEDLEPWWVKEEDTTTTGGGGGGGSSTAKRGRATIRVGNFSFVDSELELGRLLGNRFEIVLRNVCADSCSENSNNSTDGSEEPSSSSSSEATTRQQELLEAAATALQQHGFINYFGMQRFGKYQDTHLTGLQVLLGNYKGACCRILASKPVSDEPIKVQQARKTWEERFDSVDDKLDKKTMAQAESAVAKKVVRNMGRFATCEVAILQSLQHHPLNYQRAFSHAIPRNLRTMFFHASQSYMWNKLASFRIATYGKEVVEGDLVLLGDNTESDPPAAATTDVGLSTAASDSSSRPSCNSTAKEREGNVRVVTREDVEAGRYELTDVVLPLMGTKVLLPKNDVALELEKLLKEWNLTKEHYEKRHLTGDYRKLICKPRDVTWKMMTYTGDPLQPLLETDLMKIHNKKGKRAAVTTLLDRDGEGGEQGHDEEESSTLDDEMKTEEANGTTKTTTSSTTSETKTTSMDVDTSSTSVVGAAIKESDDCDVRDGGSSAKTTMLAMVLGFTLPPSAYATICLRELMKRPTSSDYQRELQLTGPCEGNLL